MADFTPEQLEAVEAAMKNHCSYFKEVSRVITELQKPAWVPKVGQAVKYGDGKWCEWDKFSKMNHTVKPFSATEIGLEPFEYIPYPPHETQMENYDGYCAAIDHVNNKLFGDTE